MAVTLAVSLLHLHLDILVSGKEETNKSKNYHLKQSPCRKSGYHGCCF